MNTSRHCLLARGRHLRPNLTAAAARATGGRDRPFVCPAALTQAGQSEVSRVRARLRNGLRKFMAIRRALEGGGATNAL
jgi:hypothetical protein